MKTNLAMVCLFVVVLGLPGCGGSSPQSRIVGKWEAGQAATKVTAEFGADGKAKLTMFGQPLQGTYQVNGDELEWTLNGKTAKHKFKVTATELEVTGDGNTITYKRVK